MSHRKRLKHPATCARVIFLGIGNADNRKFISQSHPCLGVDRLKNDPESPIPGWSVVLARSSCLVTTDRPHCYVTDDSVTISMSVTVCGVPLSQGAPLAGTTFSCPPSAWLLRW